MIVPALSPPGPSASLLVRRVQHLIPSAIGSQRDEDVREYTRAGDYCTPRRGQGLARRNVPLKMSRRVLHSPGLPGPDHDVFPGGEHGSVGQGDGETADLMRPIAGLLDLGDVDAKTVAA